MKQSIKPIILKELVIEPILKKMNMHSETAVNLLLGTCAQESLMGTYKKQVEGPAMGIYQIEYATYADISGRYLKRNPTIFKFLQDLRYYNTICEELTTNLFYQTVLVRLKYWMEPAPLPVADDISGLADTWKRVYNTYKGKGTVEEFIEKYERYGIGSLTHEY